MLGSTVNCTQIFLENKHSDYKDRNKHGGIQKHIKGSEPEWCISTIHHTWDTPFWSRTLNIHNFSNLCVKHDYDVAG